MIQRIQTVLIFLSVLGALFLYISGQDIDVFNNHLIIPITCFILIIIGGISIFSFKNRKRQLLLNNISIFINALLIVIIGYWLSNLSGGIDFPEKGIEIIFPILSIFCLSLANKYIKSDEKLVKSTNRLR